MRSWLALLPAVAIIAGALWSIPPHADPAEMLKAAIKANLCEGEP